MRILVLQTIEEVNGTKGKLKTIFISVSHFLQFPGRDLRTITFPTYYYRFFAEVIGYG